MSTSATTTGDTTATEPITTEKWLSAWARASLLYPSCAGPTGAVAFIRHLRQQEARR